MQTRQPENAGKPGGQALLHTAGRLTVILLIAFVLWYPALLMFSVLRNPAWLIIFAAALWLILPVLPTLVGKASAKYWAAAGALFFLGLLYPTAAIAESPLPPLPWEWLSRLLNGVILLLPALAIFAAAVLLRLGLALWSEARVTERGGDPARWSAQSRTAFLLLALAALLAARALNNLYWLEVWDSATDSIGVFWLVLPVAAALLSAALLLKTLPGRYRAAGLYGAAMIALMAAAYLGAKSVGFRERTTARAETVARAVEAYQSREGHYPLRLSDLVPRDLLAIPGPVILLNRGWCYDSAVAGADAAGAPATADYYRLAYVDREHWSSPEIFARVYRQKGAVPDVVRPCAAEIEEVLKLRDYYVQGEAR